jgi:hypothetical protein
MMKRLGHLAGAAIAALAMVAPHEASGSIVNPCPVRRR